MNRLGLQKYFFSLVDERGKVYAAAKKVSILSAATETAATVYADAEKTAKTNPILANTSDPIEFFYAGGKVDVLIETPHGTVCLAEVTPSDNRLVIDLNKQKCQLLYANVAAGAVLVDSAGVFVDFPHIHTLIGANLEVGDVIHIRGMVLFIDFNGTDKFDLKVLFGTEAILQTTDQQPAADEDAIIFDLYVTINTAGASGKIMVEGTWQTDINGTVVCYVKSPTGAAKELAEDLSGDVVIKCQGDYDAEHADNEAHLINLKVWHDKSGRGA